MLRLDPDLGYFRNAGVNVMAFDDIYPEGHQSGVSILMHGRRIARTARIQRRPGKIRSEGRRDDLPNHSMGRSG